MYYTLWLGGNSAFRIPHSAFIKILVMKLFNDRAMQLSEKMLDLSHRRHKILASNAANSETPAYRARDLDFAKELDRAYDVGDKNRVPANHLLRTDAQHLDIDFQPFKRVRAVYDNSGAVGADGNNVDLDINMGKISSNSGQYTNTLSLLTMKLKMLRTAITSKG